MSGLGRVVVGYRKHDRRRLQLIDDYGVHSVAVRPCVAGCGYPVFFVASGQDAVRHRDAEVICQECYDLYKDQVLAEL